MSARTRLPAYGRELNELRKAGKVPSGWALVERAWPKEPQAWTCVVPSTDDPGRYRFDFLRDLAVIVSCASTDVGNAVLVGRVEEARPAIGAVLVDREFSLWIGTRA